MAYILVLLDRAGSGCEAYWVDRELCERAAKIGAERGLPEMTPRDYARLMAITEAKADGVPLSPKIKELSECES